VDWPTIRDRTFDRTDQASARGRRARAVSDHVTLFEGRARFAGPHELIIDDGTRITADRIVLATGARPVVPPAIAAAGVGFHTSDTIMRIDELPARMVIAGGGYVAAEFAHIFSALGVDIRLVNRAPRLLESFDPDISGRFTELARRRWDVRLSATITGVRRDGDGGDGLAVLLEDGTTVAGDLRRGAGAPARATGTARRPPWARLGRPPWLPPARRQSLTRGSS
jgi:mycothione reductase